MTYDWHSYPVSPLSPMMSVVFTDIWPVWSVPASMIQDWGRELWLCCLLCAYDIQLRGFIPAPERRP